MRATSAAPRWSLRQDWAHGQDAAAARRPLLIVADAKQTFLLSGNGAVSTLMKASQPSAAAVFCLGRGRALMDTPI